MDDDLIRRLRSLEVPAEPRGEFVGELHDQLAGMLGLPVTGATTLTGAAVGTAIAGPRAATRRARRSVVRRWLLLAATVALLVAIVANIATIGATVRRLVDGPTLLERLQTAGVVRLAVRPNGPQVLAPGGTLSGFDIDVAEVVADRFGLDAELVILDTDEMLATDRPRLDIATPSRALSSSEAGPWIQTSPIYWWPVFVLVPGDAGDAGDLAAGVAAALDGRTVCVVSGSPGEGWLAPSDDRPLTVLVDAPRPQAIRRMDDDDACLADMAAGGSDAIVTGHLSRSDIATEGAVRMVGDDPVAAEPRQLLVPREAPGADAFAVHLDAVIADLRADGTLARLSRQRFGGEDLTVAPD